jgi:hypothetical protein
VQSSVRQTVEALVRDVVPDLVGLSVMTFQRAPRAASSRSFGSLSPGVGIAVGGYDPSLAPEVWTHPISASISSCAAKAN